MQLFATLQHGEHGRRSLWCYVADDIICYQTQLDAHTIKVVANIKSPGMSIKLLFLILFSIHILTLLSNFLLTTGNLNFTLKGLPTARPLNFVNIT